MSATHAVTSEGGWGAINCRTKYPRRIASVQEAVRSRHECPVINQLSAS
jgi:ribosomal protein L37AE/L43A